MWQLLTQATNSLGLSTSGIGVTVSLACSLVCGIGFTQRALVETERDTHLIDLGVKNPQLIPQSSSDTSSRPRRGCVSSAAKSLCECIWGFCGILDVPPLSRSTVASVHVAAFAATKENFGCLDVVINNAGYGLFGEAESLPLNEAREQLEVSFWGPVKISLKVRLLHAAALNSDQCRPKAVKFFRENDPAEKRRYIFNISSAGGCNGNPCLAFYSAGKFGGSLSDRHVSQPILFPTKALEGFTESLNKELLPSWNIKASIIEPGGFETRWSGDLHQILLRVSGALCSTPA